MVQGLYTFDGCETQRQPEVIVALSLDAAMYMAINYYTLRRSTQAFPCRGAAEALKGKSEGIASLGRE